MAIELLIATRQQTKCADLLIKDTTGTYATSNVTGWQTVTSGGSNIQIDNSSITVATITIVAGTSTTVINLMDIPTWRSITPYTTGNPFDNTVTPDTLQYLLPDIKLPDGANTITYHVEDSNGNIAENIFTACTYCNVKCGVYKMIDRVPDFYACKSCDNNYVDAAITTWGLYKALKLSACQANVPRFLSILKQLQDILSTLNITC